jgi:iron complex transport system substrate-binding protein
MLSTLHPDLYSLDEFALDAQDFYKTFYGFEMDTATILD